MIDEEGDTVIYNAEVNEELEISKINDNSSHTITGGNNDLLGKKRGPRKSLSDLRTPRQKFCARWQVQFPWLKANRIDESVGYCTICHKELVCKKSHLERHQKSFKHIRLQGFENMFTVNEPEAELVEAHTNGYMENESEYQNEGVLEEEGTEYTTIKVEPIVMTQQEFHASIKKRTIVTDKPLQPPSPLTTIERVECDRTNFSIPPRPIEKPREPARQREPERLRELERPREISDYYYMSRAPPPVAPQPPPKDSFDLFFESVSATVKALPPKLGAEVKSKVSQLIANFELRAICEKEAQDKAASESAALSTPVANMVAVNPTINSISSGSELPCSVVHPQHAGGQAVAHYVYAYQQK